VLPRALVMLLGAAAAVIVLGGLRATAWLIGPAFLALIVVVALSPVQAWLRRHNWPGWLTTIVLIVLVFWAWLLGPLGALLAIPLTLQVKALLVDVDPTARWATALAGSLEAEPRRSRDAGAGSPAAGGVPGQRGPEHHRPRPDPQTRATS
jgi:AI-2 transport protein TqsA